MAGHAADLVALVRDIEGVELDDGVPGLELVDRLLGRFHDAGADPERMAETVFCFGAYTGEVVVRQAGGWWVMVAEDHPMAGGWPLVERPRKRVVNPIGKAFKRVQDGTAESIAYFYEALVLR